MSRLPPWPMGTRQSALLRFITGYLAAHGGISPTQRECAAALRIPLQETNRLIARLHDRGLIRRRLSRHRAIEVLRAPTIPRAPDGSPLFAVPLPEGCQS